MRRRDLIRAIAALGFGLPGQVLRAMQAGDRTAAGRSAAAPLLAGAARIDITPDKPVALSGYLDAENRISSAVHDRIFARAIALACGTKRLVFVSCDITSFMMGPYFSRTVAERHGLTPAELWLCATHSHSAPQLSLSAEYPHPNNFEFTSKLARALPRVVGQALTRLGPARLALGRGRSTVGASRRLILPGGEVRMAANPDGPADPELLVLRLSRPNGRPFAALFDYACHSRSLRAPNRAISGDIFGIAEHSLEKAGGEGFVGAAFAGASGDIDPVEVVDGFETSDGTVPPTVRLGTLLADEAIRAMTAAEDLSARMSIRQQATRVGLPSKSGQDRPVNVSVASVGPLAFVGLDCEASVEIGLAIKAASPFAATFVLTNCNDWAGYLPVKHQYAEGGYEVGHTSFAPGAAELLVREVGTLLERLQRGG